MITGRITFQGSGKGSATFQLGSMAGAAMRFSGGNAPFAAKILAASSTVIEAEEASTAASSLVLDLEIDDDQGNEYLRVWFRTDSSCPVRFELASAVIIDVPADTDSVHHFYRVAPVRVPAS